MATTPEITEHYLLYYGEWKWVEEAGEAFPQLTYCVSLGNLSDAIANSIAVEYEINHCDQSGSWYEFHGVCPDGLNEPFYEMRPRQILPERLEVVCFEGKVCFDEEVKSGAPDEAVRFMQKIVRAASELGAVPVTARDADEIRIAVYEEAVYEGLLMAKDVSEVEKWHILSKRKYKGKGWTQLAEMVEKEDVRKGKKARDAKQMANLARTIQNQVEAFRENLEHGKDANLEQ